MIGAKKKFFGIALLFVLGLVACGDDGSGTGAKNVDDAEANSVVDQSEVGGVCHIPQCDKSLEGRKILSRDVGKVYQCQSGSWTDSLGKGFAEKDFVDCFLNAMVLDSVATFDDLKNCTENKEGSLAVVGKNLVVCASKKWAELLGHVVSEANLPECEENGSLEYVLSKMAAYQCKDGLWYRGGKAVTPAQPESSSSGKSEESSSNKSGESSSSSKSVKSSASTEPPVDDGTKVRGMCMVSERDVTKGQEVKYSFYNLGGTVVSYSWTFDDGASESTSSAAAPEVSYTSGGTHRAKLVINKGRDSESDEIECMGVSVASVPVTGCVCTTDADGLILRGENPVQAVWSVSGCAGASPFTYQWGGGASGTSTSATGKTMEPGNYAPTVMVTNSDGGTMEPVCQTVPVAESVRGKCSVQGDVFHIDRISGIADDVSSITATLVSAVDEVSLEWAIEGYQQYRFNYDTYESEYYYDYSIRNYSKEVESGISTFAVYALVHAGDTVCTATKVSCAPSVSRVNKDESVTWGLQSQGWTEAGPSSYLWTFMDKDGDTISTSNLASPEFTASAYGKVKATLVLDKGLVSENRLVCSNLTVMESTVALTDSRDDQTYRIANIGSQVWMAENLNYDTLGSACFGNELDSCAKYGRLYSAGQAQTVCPEGWHLPSQAEFEELLGSVENDFDNLKAEEWGGEDTYGFSALPAGKNDVLAGEFTTWQFITGWWLQASSGSYSSPLYGVSDYSYHSGFTSDDSENGFSVRCVMD